jgi:hypothetical protein
LKSVSFGVFEAERSCCYCNFVMRRCGRSGSERSGSGEGGVGEVGVEEVGMIRCISPEALHIGLARMDFVINSIM